MPNLKDLPSDVYRVLEENKFTEASVQNLSDKLRTVLLYRLGQEQADPTLRMSNMGQPCERKLYYDIHNADQREPLNGQTLLKFLYGAIVEELVLWLASEAGHSVQGEQDELTIAGVKGHRDAVVDGVVCDVKTASGRGMEKFEKHLLEHDDPFGYLGQLGGYLAASQDDPLVTVKQEAAFIAVNKENGEIVVDTYKFDTDPEKWAQTVEAKRNILAKDKPPVRGFNPIPDGASGNMKLGVNCRYCSHKHNCWPGLRTFAYSNGPAFLTKVIKEPKVPEIK